MYCCFLFVVGFVVLFFVLDDDVVGCLLGYDFVDFELGGGFDGEVVMFVFGEGLY